MSSALRILIIDQNKVYASLVKEELHKAHSDVSVDIAVNVFELRRKMAERKYNLIIADVAVTEDENEIAEEISRSEAHVIAWTSVSKKCRTSACMSDGAIREMRKPSSVAEMRKLIPIMVARR